MEVLPTILFFTARKASFGTGQKDKRKDGQKIRTSLSNREAVCLRSGGAGRRRMALPPPRGRGVGKEPGKPPPSPRPTDEVKVLRWFQLEGAGESGSGSRGRESGPGPGGEEMKGGHACGVAGEGGAGRSVREHGGEGSTAGRGARQLLSHSTCNPTAIPRPHPASLSLSPVQGISTLLGLLRPKSLCGPQPAHLPSKAHLWSC